MKKFNLHNNRLATQVSYLTYAAGDRNLGLYRGEERRFLIQKGLMCLMLGINGIMLSIILLQVREAFFTGILVK